MSTQVSHLAVRMKRLPLRHRLVHLAALIRREPAGSTRTPELVALLRDQLAATPSPSARSFRPMSPDERPETRTT